MQIGARHDEVCVNILTLGGTELRARLSWRNLVSYCIYSAIFQI